MRGTPTPLRTAESFLGTSAVVLVVYKLPASYRTVASLLCSQERAAGHYPELPVPSSHPHTLFNVLFKIVFSFIRRFSIRSVYFRLSRLNGVGIYHLSHVCYVFPVSHLPSVGDVHNMRKIQIMKLLIVKVFQFFRYVLHLRSGNSSAPSTHT
jgi:hypothetical protein